MNSRIDSILNFKFILSLLGIGLKKKGDFVSSAKTCNMRHGYSKPTSLYHFEVGDIASIIDDIEVCPERKICIIRFKVSFDGKKIRSFKTEQGNIFAFAFDEFLVEKNEKCKRPGKHTGNHYRCVVFPISEPCGSCCEETDDDEKGSHDLSLNVSGQVRREATLPALPC